MLSKKWHSNEYLYSRMGTFQFSSESESRSAGATDRLMQIGRLCRKLSPFKSDLNVPFGLLMTCFPIFFFNFVIDIAVTDYFCFIASSNNKFLYGLISGAHAPPHLSAICKHSEPHGQLENPRVTTATERCRKGVVKPCVLTEELVTKLWFQKHKKQEGESCVVGVINSAD